MIIGVISDTHGVVSPAVIDAFSRVDQIVHAGDIGSPEVLEVLTLLAPVTAVRGNTDHANWAENLPKTEMVTLSRILVYLLHDLDTLDLDPPTAGVDMVISGHTHTPKIHRLNGVLYVNPGSASQQRNGGPLSVGRITISPNTLDSEIILLGR